MSEPCTQQPVLNEIKEDIKEMKSDIKSLLQFKWQIMGMTGLLVFLISVGFNLYRTFGG